MKSIETFEYKEWCKYPHNAFLNLTNDCNLQCRYCFVEQHPDYMDFETAKKAVDFLYNNLQYKKEKQYIEPESQSSLVFFGGEPLLLYDKIIVPLTEYINKNYQNLFKLSITTNGILLNENKLQFLKNNNIGILQSIDGNKVVQDYNRPCKNGQSSFDIIKSKIPTILKYYPDVVFRSTTTPDTIGQLYDSYLFAEEQGYKNYYVTPNHREPWSLTAIQEMEKQIQNIFCHQLNQFKQNILPIIFSTETMMFEEILQIELSEYEKIPEFKNPFRCGLGTTSIGIGPDGKIYGCQDVPSKKQDDIFYIGDIIDGINEDRQKLLLNSYSHSQPNVCINEQLCINCPYKPACQGMDKSCPFENYDLFNNFYTKTEIECLWNQNLYYNCICLINILFEENNILFQQYLNKYCNYKSYLKEEGK